MKCWIWIAAAWMCMILAVSGEEKDKTIKVDVGQEFKLTLEANPSTGNQWLLARPLDERLLKFLGTEYRRGRGGAPGSSGNEILSFRALSEGKTEIHLKYGRLWEHDATPARKTNFVVSITKVAGR